MSKTAQRKRSAYQEGFNFGRRGIRHRVNPRWIYAAEFRSGWYAGRRARLDAERETYVLPVEQEGALKGTLAVWLNPVRLTINKVTGMWVRE